MVARRRTAALRWVLKCLSDTGCLAGRVAFGAVLVAAVISAAAAAGAASRGQLYPQGTPTRAIQDLDAKLDEFKTGVLTPEEEAYNRQIKQDIIHGTFDIRELSRQSLAKHWKARTPAERDQFVQILTDLLEEKALFSKEQSVAKSKKKNSSVYRVEYRGHKFYDKAKTRAYVRTRVVLPNEDISITLNYRLKKKGDEWKIYDVIVDEASLVDNYRYQFNSIITKHGYPDLVSRMNKKLGDIKSKRKGSKKGSAS